MHELWKKNLIILWAAQFIAIMGMSLVVPFLPFYIKYLGVPSASEAAYWSGIVFAGPFFISFFLTPFWGWLGDRYGQKPMVVRAVFGLALSQLLVGAAQNVTMLFFFRMIQGALSGFVPAALSLVSVSTPKEKSGYAIGIISTASAVGAVIGPLVGGTLADVFGYRVMFFIVAGLCAAAGVLVVRFVQEPKQTPESTQRSYTLLSNYHYSLRNSQIRAALILILLSQSAMMMVQPIFALFVEELTPRTEYLATLAGAAFSVTGVFMTVGSPWWGRRNDKHEFKTNITAAILGSGIAFALQGFVTGIYQLLVLRALQGFSAGGVLPGLYSYISKHAEQERRGGVTGIASSLNILANMVGPITGGMLASAAGVRANFFLAGGVLLATVLVARGLFSNSRSEKRPRLRQRESTEEETVSTTEERILT